MHKTLRRNSLLQIFSKYFSSSSYAQQNGLKKPNFGICFDIDGVLVRGHVPFEESIAAMNLLKSKNQNKFIYPVAFVTNALAPRLFKAHQLQEWLHTQIDPDQVIMAQTGFKMYKDIRKKKLLLIGQGSLQDIAKDLLLEDVCFIEELTECYPLLDVGLHDNRNRVSEAHPEDKYFPPVEGIVLMGEPKHWESPLQILIDLLLTKGQPSKEKVRQNKQTIPVYACNLDLQYMHKATFPRFGHGAFLLCLESLFKKVTGTDLKYEALIGKPSEVTMRFTEHRLSMISERLGSTRTLRTMYMVGDNQDVDITAANVYQNYIDYCNNGSSAYTIPEDRFPPNYENLLPQTVKNVRGILVKTGVYQAEHKEGNHVNNHSHRDFPLNKTIRQAYNVSGNVYDAVKFILQEEGF